MPYLLWKKESKCLFELSCLITFEVVIRRGGGNYRGVRYFQKAYAFGPVGAIVCLSVCPSICYVKACRLSDEILKILTMAFSDH